MVEEGGEIVGQVRESEGGAVGVAGGRGPGGGEDEVASVAEAGDR